MVLFRIGRLTTSLELVADRVKKEHLSDLTAMFGPNGDLYLVHMRFEEDFSGKVNLLINYEKMLDQAWMKHVSFGTVHVSKQA